MNLDIRGTFPSIGGRNFFVIMLGKDRRTLQSNVNYDRRKNSPMAVVVITITLFLWAMAGTLVITGASLYIAKKKSGIDLVPGSHPVPEMLRKVGVCR